MAFTINFSSKRLTEQQLNVIEKGLNFVPTYECQKFEFMTDFHKFCHKIRLKIFFADKQKSDIRGVDYNINSKLHAKSMFDPKVSNTMLASFQQIVYYEVLERWDRFNIPRINLQKDEYRALKELKYDNTINKKRTKRGGGSSWTEINT